MDIRVNLNKKIMHPFLKFFKNLFLKFGIAIISWGSLISIEQSIEMYLKIPNEVGYWSPLYIIVVIIYAAIFTVVSFIAEIFLYFESLNTKKLLLTYILAGPFSLAATFYLWSFELSATWLPLFLSVGGPLACVYILWGMIHFLRRKFK